MCQTKMFTTEQMSGSGQLNMLDQIHQAEEEELINSDKNPPQDDESKDS